MFQVKAEAKPWRLRPKFWPPGQLEAKRPKFWPGFVTLTLASIFWSLRQNQNFELEDGFQPQGLSIS